MSHRRQHGRHRAPSKPVSRFIFPVLLLVLLPVSIALGYLTLSLDSATQTGSVDPYAGTVTIAASPLSLTPAPVTSQAQPAEIPGTNHTTPPLPGPEKPTQSATESPEPQDPKPAVTEAPTQDQEAPTATTEPPKAKDSASSSSKCENLESKENVVRACNAIMEAFPQVTSMGGKAARPENPTSCHPFGLGLDVMVPSNELGDDIVKWISSRRKELEIAWIGWEVPDHWNHVHLSFDPCKG